ncbi:63 kDa sperm flagellar membrane protein-like [Asterias rubens]|uniref:63 kDa sperm flagellar membrane protein-like n=1 Tax=Asterias rubens TaxID=7604 RepID=UPI001454F5C6|nr:63 kDa sperm flagellar membrane protein-like [Asterias rubens]
MTTKREPEVTHESESTTKPADESESTTSAEVEPTERVTVKPEVESTTEGRSEVTLTRTSKPEENTTKAVSVAPKSPEVTGQPIDPCFSDPCAGKANSECISKDDGSYTCSCIALYYESNGQCVASSTFKCRLRVTRIQTLQAEFTAELADPTSQDFQSMAADMTSVIDSIFMGSRMSNQYLGCTIFGFSSGSIIVDYIAHIDDVEPTNSTVVESAFTESYMQSANDGRLNVTADVAASGVTDFDECLSTTTNDCSVNASCINIEGAFTCECHSGLVDLAPTKPGRFCAAPQPKVCDNQADIDCSPYAACYDTDTRPEGYSCQCLSGFRDQSPSISLMPGRVCEEICPSSNCFNGGSCVSVYETGETICRCPEGFDGTKCENVVESGLSETLILVISLISVASLILIGITLLLCFTFYHRHTKESIKKLSLRSTSRRGEPSRFMQDADVWDPIIMDDRSSSHGSSSQQTLREPRHNQQMTTFSEQVRHDSHDDGISNLDFIDEEVESLARTNTTAMSKLPEVEVRSLILN